MHLLLFLPYYIRWHYGRALKDFYSNWLIFIEASFTYFSVSLLLKTLFAPWKRLQDEYKEGFHPKEFFQTAIINFIMRLVGFVCRGAVIILGIFVTTTIFIAGIFSFFLWLLFPIVFAFLVALALKQII